MPESFWAAYAEKLAIVALVLGALYFIGRTLRRARSFAGGRRMKLLESLALSPNAALHLVRVGSRRFLIGSGVEVGVLAEFGAGDAGGDDLT